MSNNSEKSALFELTDSALYVANGGRPFSRLGVIGICAAHLSDKGSARKDRYEKSENGKALIDAIQEREIKTYEVNPGRLEEDFGGEKEVHRDYERRFVWELLQNADDAMGPENRADLIGSKGLGFKSVLEITEEPEIHSGPFHFKFSPDKTKQLLKNEEIDADPPSLVFRIPHNCEPDPKVHKLLNDYTTVIRLPFRNQEAHEKTRKALADLKPHFLLLSQQLDAVCITGLEQEERLYRIEREGTGLSDDEIALHTPEDSSFWKRWVESEVVDNEGKKVTVSIALPVKDGGAVPFDSELPFHVFFPTEESLGVKALVHASFDLEQNRKHLREGDNDSTILPLFGNLLEKVIQGTPPQTALETFGSVQCNDNDKELLKQIKASMLDKMKTTPFVPVVGDGKFPPTETRLWKDELGDILREDEQAVKDAKLVAPELSSLFSALKGLGAQYIEDDEHIRLLRYCRNGSQEECIASFQALAKTVLSLNRHHQLNDLRKVPCWWTNKQTSRSLEAEPPLLWKKPNEWSDWPDWLAVDSLDPEFQKEIEKWKEKEKSESYDQLTKGYLSKEEQHYINWVFIPAIKEWDQQQWKQLGYKVLKWLAVWEKPHDFNDTLPWIKDDEDHPRRRELATILRLPTVKGWLPATDCFAGKAWDGPEAFDEFFAGLTILPLEKWGEDEDLREIDKDRWKGLLRWSGVSWEPKVCRTLNFKVDHPLWEDRTLRGDTLPGGENYLIQDFPNCIENVENKELIQDIFPNLFKLIESNEALRLWAGPQGGRRPRETPPSIAYKQLEKEAWLPVEPSLLGKGERISPKEAFLPGRGLKHFLPEVDRSGIDNHPQFGQEDIESWLRELGVMDELPDDVSQWHEWMRQLAKTSETWPDDPQVSNEWKSEHTLWRAARSLYQEYLKREVSLSPLPKDIRIPCVCLNKEGQRILSFNLPDDPPDDPLNKVYWIDEPHLADPTLERGILDRGYHLFIFRLNDGKNSERLGVRKLSDVIEVKPCYAPDPDYENSRKALFQRYEEEKRKIVLEKVCDIELPQFGALEIKAVRDLKLKLSTDGVELGECSVESWKDSESGYILIDVANNKWDTFAHALAHRWDGGKHKKYHATLENYFSADQYKFKRRARDAGFTEEALEDDTETTDAPVSITEGAPPRPPVTGTTHDIGTTKDRETTDFTDTKRTADGTDAPAPITEGASSRPPVTGTTHDIGTTKDRETTNFTDTKRTPGGDARTPRPESGLPAEKWLWEQLNKKYPGSVRSIHAGADFILDLGEREIHIEAKHVETHPGVIHWSEQQYESAEDREVEGNSYFIAVLSPVADSTEYDIHWIWDPLEELKELEKREVVWEGKSAPQRLQKGKWEAEETDPQVVRTKTFKIKITLENICRDENKDDSQLARLKEKIQSA